uniref:Universal stress protein n=1 Tax=Desulfobacca acetoxidans TaxID=60893 RepID=A0A7C3UZV1_9BACT
MLPVKRILVPTDFSEPAKAAFQTAVELARHFSSQLLLVHAVPPVPVPYEPMISPAPSFDITSYLQELINGSKQTLETYAREHVPPGVAATTSVSAGDPAFEILRLAQELEADLIVIATHGRGGWRRFLFGSVAEKVVREAECPVLVVHAPKSKGKDQAGQV